MKNQTSAVKGDKLAQIGDKPRDAVISVKMTADDLDLLTRATQILKANADKDERKPSRNNLIVVTSTAAARRIIKDHGG